VGSVRVTVVGSPGEGEGVRWGEAEAKGEMMISENVQSITLLYTYSSVLTHHTITCKLYLYSSRLLYIHTIHIVCR